MGSFYYFPQMRATTHTYYPWSSCTDYYLCSWGSTVQTLWYVIVISVHTTWHGPHLGGKVEPLARDVSQGYSLYHGLYFECQRHGGATAAEQW